MKSALSLLACFVVASAASAQDDYPRRETAEIRVRGGIPNLLRKANAADGRERWRYDEAAQTWWLVSGLPDLWADD